MSATHTFGGRHKVTECYNHLILYVSESGVQVPGKLGPKDVDMKHVLCKIPAQQELRLEELS
jgi:hypothetical protein